MCTPGQAQKMVKRVLKRGSTFAINEALPVVRSHTFEMCLYLDFRNVT
jgi:hypothetical protein